jgi:hypothetical protein
LADRIEGIGAALVVFTFQGSPFKAAAVAYLGRFEGGDLLRDGGIGGARVFVLLGPMQATASAEAKITTLRSLLGS